MKIKELLDRYYEGETTDAEEQRLREYFSSDDVAVELQPYRSIFSYLNHERQVPGSGSGFNQSCIIQKSKITCAGQVRSKNRKSNWWYAAAAAVACLLTATFLIHEFQPKPQALCEGTYVMINGICYDDLALVRKYATETIDMVTQPFGNGSAADALDFLD